MINRKLLALKHIVKRINSLSAEMEKLTEDEMKEKTEQFRTRISNGDSLDKILPEAFALVKEAARRVLGYSHYDVQLIGGIALHRGYIAEMKTGEGKTLVSTTAAYLNALTGQGVHVVTVNDYLAERDSEWMGQIHRMLGLSVGCVLAGMSMDERKIAYSCDITYVTNNELGFDYLRDNMATSRDGMVLRGLSYCIIDEADSVLIDEARTPLIISGPGTKVTKLYHLCDVLARQMKKGEEIQKFSRTKAFVGEEAEETGDFIVDEESQSAILTVDGIRKVEAFFGLENLSDEENTDIRHHIILAIKAHYLMERDVDYIVKDGEVIIVDEFTGRIMEGRRYSDGLHQAIEAKEHVEVQSENLTMATITLQNFFNKYEKKCGMTGTAYTERKEFRETYGMDVFRIPTNRQVIRHDHKDLVYKTKKEKYAAVINEIRIAHLNNQPVLVGTTSIETSEYLSGLLKSEGIPHKVLNAKFDKEEADIVAKAGEPGAVTIATNMAGRGTDIKLTEESSLAHGLKVIGTERHESRRIDDQLCGRSGRQGDPGDSIFFLSLEDDLIKLNANENITSQLLKLDTNYGDPIAYKNMQRYVRAAQEKVELNNYGVRESLLEYDMVNHFQREAVYKKRLEIIDSKDLHAAIKSMVKRVIKKRADKVIRSSKTINYEKLGITLGRFLGKELNADNYPTKNRKKLIRLLSTDAVNTYEAMVQAVGNPERFRAVERTVYLRIIDSKWTRHLADMEKLREMIRYQTIGQRDPLVEYRLEAAHMYERFWESVEADTVETLIGMRARKR